MALIPVILFLYYVNCFTTASDPCSDYENLNTDNTRSPSHIEAEFANANCDATLNEQWYRIIGDAGTDLTNDSGLILGNACGTFNQMWMRGSIPEVADGIVDRTICLKTIFSSCHDSFTIQVMSCCSFRVYYLKSSNGCPHSYCVSDAGFESTDSCPDPITTTTEETTVDSTSMIVTATEYPATTTSGSITTNQHPLTTTSGSTATTQHPVTTTSGSTTTTKHPTTTSSYSTATTEYTTITYIDSTTSSKTQKEYESDLKIVKKDNTLIIVLILIILVGFTAVVGLFIYTLKIKKTVRSNSLMPICETTTGFSSSPPPRSYAFVDRSIHLLVANGGIPGRRYLADRGVPDLALRYDVGGV
ncbi:uncharacterized protein LOC110464739 [Mizuhopecten yessoensis]|uniref:Oncoprotein-induced transcript 3 protein n=1 Tax=Mizuhopecten yessoensis TaxID=6573 RepID=A0A210PT56_MIZYE|nr:uncharacterized protein LOC110464739 [Mizuhopecten yessoensis]OWF39668.1 Oncoprotein-induced transcript 3 protein [Mizuhopecten yessoensis]